MRRRQRVVVRQPSSDGSPRPMVVGCVEMKQKGPTIGTSAGGAAVMARSAMTRALVGLAVDLRTEPAALSRPAGK